MKAIVYKKYGPPEALQIQEVAKPAPKANEVLIKIHATTVTATDCQMRRGEPRWSRLILGLGKPRKKILGIEFSGVVEAVGKNVQRLQPGDAVFGAAMINLIFDAVGKTTFSRCKTALKPGGVFLACGMTEFLWPVLPQMLWTALTGGKKVKTGSSNARPEHLNFLKELVEAGELRSAIDRVYPLEQIVEAHRYVETGHKRGNVVITL